MKSDLQWRSDAESKGLPITNRRDSKGAPLLQVDRIVRASDPPRAVEQHWQTGVSFSLIALVGAAALVVITLLVIVVVR